MKTICRNDNIKQLSAILIAVLMFLCWVGGTATAAKIDFGPSPQTRVQSGGYTAFSVDSISNLMQTVDITSALANSGTLTVGVIPSEDSEAGGGAMVKGWHRGVSGNPLPDPCDLEASGILGDLITDFIYTTPSGANGIDIVIQDLKVGYYNVKLYLNDPGTHNLRNDGRIQVKDAASLGTFRYFEIAQEHSVAVDTDSDPISSPEFVVQADGTSDVILRLTATYSGGDSATLTLNGLELSTAAGFPSARTDLDIDFGPSDPNTANTIDEGQEIEAGFEGFSFKNPYTNEILPKQTYSSELGMGNRVTLAMEKILGNDISKELNTFIRPEGPAVLNDLLEDFAYIYGDLSITISDLKPGYYQIKTYHNDPNYPRPPVDILIVESEGSVERLAEGILDQTGEKAGSGGNASTATFKFKSDGSDVVINLDSWYAIPSEQYPAPIALINGFELEAADPNTLQVDIGAAGQAVESGFIDMTDPCTVIGYSNALGSGTVTIESSGLATQVDLTNAGALNSDLLSDYAESSPQEIGAGLKLTVTGLNDDVYTVYTHHNDPNVPHTPIQVTVNGQVASESFEQSSVSEIGDTVATHAATFEVKGGSDLEVIITVQESSGVNIEELVEEGEFGLSRTEFNADTFWTDDEFGDLCVNIMDANSYDDMAPWTGGLAGWSGNLLYMNFSSWSNRDYAFQEIDTAVANTKYILNSMLGWRLWQGSTLTSTDPYPGPWDQGHIGNTMYTYAGIALLDASIDPWDPNSCIDMADHLVVKNEISHTFTAISNQFNWVPTSQVDYTVTVGDAGKRAYVVVGAFEEGLEIGCCTYLGAQAVVDWVSVMKTSSVISLSAVLDGLEIIQQNDPRPDNHPAFCGDYGTVYLDADGNKDCDVNLGDMAALFLEWLECNNPTGDCAD